MLWRILRTLEHLLTGALISVVIGIVLSLGRQPKWQPAVVRWWHGRLCRILALNISVTGQPATGNTLLVANHVSWLDIPVLGAQGPIGFLSKAEVRRWPLIGWMATLAGTLYIERGAHQFGAAISAVRERIETGRPVVLFPEGTTSDGVSVRRFLPRLFAVVQPGSDSPATQSEPPGVQLQPLVLRYGQGPEPDRIAPFIDDTALVPHLFSILKHPGICVQVTFLPVMDVRGQARRELADQARRAILAVLNANQNPLAAADIAPA